MMRVLIRPTGFYVNAICARSGATTPLQGPVAVSPSSFSKRQQQILKGMVDGKTNHDLARELGFSVSTIRHETMRIYQILGVSDRREAAREAMERELV
jgi:DNA-binding NarL/FixJ family response regulator